MKKLKRSSRAKHWTRGSDRRRQGREGLDRLAVRYLDRRSARPPGPARRMSTAWSAPPMPRRSNGTSSAARQRAKLLDRAADLFEQHREELFSLCIREAGKTVADAVLEVREAVDFLRYYASEARRQFAQATTLPGPTGELNELRLHGRGVFACISPVEFPAGDLHRPGRGRARRGQCRHRQAGRANPADRRARDRADARGGHPQGDRPACARRRPASAPR